MISCLLWCTSRPGSASGFFQCFFFFWNFSFIEPRRKRRKRKKKKKRRRRRRRAFSSLLEFFTLYSVYIHRIKCPESAVVVVAVAYFGRSTGRRHLLRQRGHSSLVRAHRPSLRFGFNSRTFAIPQVPLQPLLLTPPPLFSSVRIPAIDFDIPPLTEKILQRFFDLIL